MHSRLFAIEFSITDHGLNSNPASMSFPFAAYSTDFSTYRR